MSKKPSSKSGLTLPTCSWNNQTVRKMKIDKAQGKIILCKMINWKKKDHKKSREKKSELTWVNFVILLF